MDSDKLDTNESALNPTVKKLGLVSFFADVSSEMLYPITPLFLTTVLGASATPLGVIEGCAEAVASLLKTYSGFWSDRIEKRKPFIWVGYLLAAIGKPLVGFSETWTQVLLARSIDRTGKGLRTAPRDALLAEAVPAHLRGSAFGWHRMMDTLGAAVGPLFAIWYLQYSENLRGIYLLAFIPGLLAVAIALTVKDKVKVGAHNTPIKKWSSLASLPKEFKYYLVSWSFFALANSSDVFLLLRAKQSGMSLTNVILVYCFYNLVYSLMSPYLGGLSDRIGRRKVLLFGLFVFALVYIGFIFASSEMYIWILFAIYGLYMAATDGVGKALAIDLIHKDQKATAIGYLGTVTGIATLVASSAAGWLWDHYGSAAAFGYGAVGAVLTFVALLFLKTPQKLSH